METSGKIFLRDGVIRYESPLGSWELACDSVRLIGEATNEDGPFFDDYWFCFATNAEGWYEASFYADGSEDFLRDLSAHLGQPIELDLQSSATFRSRILWPPEFKGKAMFVYTDQWPRNALLKAVAKVLHGPVGNTQTFSPDVEQFLRMADKRSHQ